MRRVLAHLTQTTKEPFLTTERLDLITLLDSKAKVMEAFVFLFLSEHDL